MSSSATSAANKFRVSVKLVDAGNHPRWHQCLNDQFFKHVRIPNMDSMTSAATLAPTYFKNHAQFKDDWREASKDNDNKTVDPLDDSDMVQSCLDHALDTGKGFYPWVYDAFAGIRESVSDDIADSINGVATGDIVSLLSGINLAVGHQEYYNSIELRHLCDNTKMAVEGGNDVGKFLSVLAQRMRRLKTAKREMADDERQALLLRGLNQEVFSQFIEIADRHPHDNYDKLVHALRKASAKPAILKLLRALKPGTSHSAMTTRSHEQQRQPTNLDGRLDRLETILLADAAGGAANACFQFTKTGTCRHGSKCRYTHSSNTNHNNNNNSKRNNNNNNNNDDDNIKHC